VHLLWAKGLNEKVIHKEIFPVYSGKCLSSKVVYNWVEKFSQGCSKVADDARPGRPVETATEATMQRVEELVLADRRMKIDSVATKLRCSYGLAYSKMHDDLKYQKSVCTVGEHKTEGSRKN
jgi:transposase